MGEVFRPPAQKGHRDCRRLSYLVKCSIGIVATLTIALLLPKLSSQPQPHMMSEALLYTHHIVFDKPLSVPTCAGVGDPKSFEFQTMIDYAAKSDSGDAVLLTFRTEVVTFDLV